MDPVREEKTGELDVAPSTTLSLLPLVLLRL
jgi:hypothetical protein